MESYMGIYEKYFLPKLLNLVMKSPDLAELRRQWVPEAKGKVLEVGIGSGLNLPFYSSGVHVIGVDPSIELQQYAREVAEETNVDVEFLAQGCEDLPLGSETMDSAVVTWTFCTIPEPEVALAEIRRVLKPSGKLIFVEHGLAKEEKVARTQNRINPAWKLFAGGCHLNREPDKLLLDAGFKFETITESYVPGPKFATYNYRGIASLA
ncbi:MAG: class I SAM-dependent methyltransferase [Pseudomonadales bacterium]|nr:class I SAM-dependent methyltransferase [Pseudomonadales bacterium]